MTSVVVGVCRVQANLSHLGGLVHFGGKQCRLGGFGPFWREAISSGFGPFWRVQSYAIPSTSEFNRHRQTDRQTVAVGRSVSLINEL